MQTNHCSVSELVKDAQSVIAQVVASDQPLFITQNGHASVVMVNADTYLTNMQALREFERIAQGEAHARSV